MVFSPFVKQLFVAGAPILSSLSMGGALSYPTVLLHQLKKNDSTIPLDFDTASWIGAIHGLAGTPSILMPTLMQWKGRRFTFIVSCISFIIGWILAYAATNIPLILASESFHGFGSNSIYAVTCLTINEMIAPAYRDVCMQMYFLLEALIMTLNGIMTNYLHWKTISLILCAPMVPALIIAFMWPESPYWLACKGEFTECEKSFVWLRGTDSKAKKELKDLITAKKEISHKEINIIKYYLNVIRSRDFYLPASHIVIIQCLIHGSGSLVILIYSMELFRQISGSEDVAFYGSFVLNGMQLIGVAISIPMERYFNKKTILLTSALGAIVSLTCASLTLYLQSIGVVGYISCLYCLAVFAVLTSYGIIALASPIASSLMPVKHRGIGGVLYIVSNTCVLYTLALKSFPYLVLYVGLSGTFLVYAFNAAISGLIIWKYVPEIRGRTLQEIEDYYAHGSFMDGPGNDVYAELVRGDEI